MKLKTSFLLCLSMAFFNSTFSQPNQYNLSDFKIQNFRYQALKTFANLNHTNSHTGEDNVIGNNNNNDNQSNSDFLANLSLDYLGYWSDEFQQRNLSADFDFFTGIGSHLFDNRENIYKNYMTRVDLKSSNRKYYDQENLNFFEYGIDLNTFLIKSKNISRNGLGVTNTTSFKTKNLEFLLSIKTGNGRIDQVTDARQAIYILNKLKKVGKLTNEVSDDNVQEFAQLIADVKNKRFFDFRLRLIYELEAIDSFLQSKNLISDPDIRYFTNLNDMWRFGNLPLRFSGQRFSLTLLTGYKYYSSYRGTIFDDAKIKTKSLHLGIEYIKEKSVNMYSQSTFELFAFAGAAGGKIKYFDSSTGSEDKYALPKINFGMSERLGFYPNTRTSMEYEVSIQYARIYNSFSNRDLVYEVNNRGVNIGSEVKINYYFSPRLRATGTASINYNFSKAGNGVDDNLNFLVRNHLLFLINNNPQCGSEPCSFDFEYKKDYSTYLNLSLSYGFF